MNILVTGGFNENEGLPQNDVSEIQLVFNTQTSKIKVEKGLVKKLPEMMVKRSYHSICYDEIRNQIVVACGLDHSKNLCSSIEFGKYEKI